MKIEFETSVNIGDSIYRVEFYSREPNTDLNDIGEITVYGFSVGSDGVWIEYDELGHTCTKLEDIDAKKEDTYGCTRIFRLERKRKILFVIAGGKTYAGQN